MGSLEGTIKFSQQGITFDNQLRELEHVIINKLYLNDYYGLNLGNPKTDFNPRLSQGINNSIEFTYQEKSYVIYFKLNFKTEKERLSEFITLAIKLKKISFLRGIELLNINDYDDIQEFKKTLNI